MVILMNYAEIKTCDIANGPGVRVSLFVSGCTHHCKGCFNEMTWDFHYGEPFTAEIEDYLLEVMKKPYIKGLTLLGGEPLEPANRRALIPFLKKVKENCPDKDIWCYTGFIFDKDLTEQFQPKTDEIGQFLRMIDVLVDGPFLLDQKDISLKFKGSSNQRIIDIRKTMNAKEIIQVSF